MFVRKVAATPCRAMTIHQLEQVDGLPMEFLYDGVCGAGVNE